MSWLFGSLKRSSPKREVYVSNETEDGFDVVSVGNTQPHRPQGPGNMLPYPVGPMPGTSGSGPGYPMYPNLPPVPSFPGHPYLAICPQAPPDYKPPPVHPLDSVPFKLSLGLDLMTKTATRGILTELESIRSRLDKVSEHVKSSDYHYSFELERSVLQEERMAANLT